MWNQVGSPSMFEGNTFLPLHGIPIACSARSRTRLADWLPDPLTVPTRIARSLTVARAGAGPSGRECVSATESGDGMVCLGETRAPRPFARDASGVPRIVPCGKIGDNAAGTVHALTHSPVEHNRGAIA